MLCHAHFRSKSPIASRFKVTPYLESLVTNLLSRFAKEFKDEQKMANEVLRKATVPGCQAAMLTMA